MFRQLLQFLNRLPLSFVYLAHAIPIYISDIRISNYLRKIVSLRILCNLLLRGEETRLSVKLWKNQKKPMSWKWKLTGYTVRAMKFSNHLPLNELRKDSQRFQQLLEQNTGQSDLALQKLLGPITFEPTYPDIGKPYYVAQTSLNALAIVVPLTEFGNTNNGANSYLWWTWSQRIRTLSALPFEVEIFSCIKTTALSDNRRESNTTQGARTKPTYDCYTTQR